jgi:hypothetical protein
MTRAVEVRGLRKTFDSGRRHVEALQGIDLATEEREYLVLLGHLPIPAAPCCCRAHPASRPPDAGDVMITVTFDNNAEVLRRRYARRHLLSRVGVYVAAVFASLLCAGRSCGARSPRSS